ncbi:NAD(P)H-dependent oxidoreductase [Campylobacter curvus]|uniref:NAD(P)H-dependent oxidoreductase n=1 Tax=Campylobacter curvus TaxID=200 RepID=UPI00035E2EE6|nr:NAD(P)H-dependent oxidoreductase [Campylobacter curvus]QKF61893.1 flavodoxin-like fold domain-containing protein, putative NAD(P)H (quinone) dehydrogenase/reductase [Campylobacter curvus]UEB50181.1 NAD(P)H-dependent oxidoreductase [Campylobacter curvus]
MKTIVIMSHPYFEDSRINRALFEAAKGVPDVSVRHLEAIYGSDTRAFDAKAEQDLLIGADRIVFQFPMFWFSVPPMLKAYMDEVLKGKFINDNGSSKLDGKELQIAISIGAQESEYSKKGSVKFTLGEILLPLQLGAYYCGMTFNRIFAAGGALGATEADIKAHVQRYVKLLKNELEEDEYQI